MGYLKKSIISVSWVSAFRFFNRSLAFMRTALLARLLSPAQFGTYGIATLVLGLVEICTETGINIFFVQHKDDDAIVKYINTAWVISIIRGLIISLVVAASAFPIGSFYESSTVVPLILVLSLVPLIRGFINPAGAKFQKKLEFDKEFLFRSLISLADAAVAITFAFMLKNPFSLAFGLVAGALTEVILTQLFINPKPKFIYNLSQAKEIVSQGKWITSAGIISYFANNGIDASIGKLLSTTALGYYQMSYKFSVLFINELVEMFNRVAFPVYVKIGGDRRRLRIAFLKTYATFAGASLMLMSGVFFGAEIIVNVVLGPTWVGIVPYLKLMTLVGLAIALTTPTDPLLLATKNQKKLTLAVMIQFVALALGIMVIQKNPTITNFILVLATSIAVNLPLRTFWAVKILLPSSR